ncbi:MAG: DEAD/DEAH box helicase [Treponema sp.]|jgi:superfamily II DNA/RNA helicase|nr:DEAD/DEAH box helicase [Treponema sp.]
MTDNFCGLAAAPCFARRLEERNIRKATDIQKKVIPRLAAGESVFFSSATGTGKTFAYLLPLLGRLLDQDAQSGGKNAVWPRLLITAPTLELCSQIKGELDFLLDKSAVSANAENDRSSVSLRSCLLIGSVNLERQIEMLRKSKSDVIIGNPARLLVLAKMGKLRFGGLSCLVLDEADRLVSDELSGETRELCEIIKRAVRDGSNLTIAACSATMNEKNREKLLSLAIFRDDKNANISRNVEYIESEGNEILRERIEHWAIFSEKRRKIQTLRSLLAAIKAKKSRSRALIFTSRGDEAETVLSHLLYHHVNAAGLFAKSGKKPLAGTVRKEALDAFRRGEVDALVSTDLAARGLDIPGITHIIALDVPSDSEVYIHRCGRTGRAGKYGVMVTIGNETQMRLLASLEKKLKIRVLPKELYQGRICAPAQVEDI